MIISSMQAIKRIHDVIDTKPKGFQLWIYYSRRRAVTWLHCVATSYPAWMSHCPTMMGAVHCIWQLPKATWTVSYSYWSNVMCRSIRKIDGAIRHSMKLKHLAISKLSNICGIGRVGHAKFRKPIAPMTARHHHLPIWIILTQAHFHYIQLIHLHCHKFRAHFSFWLYFGYVTIPWIIPFSITHTHKCLLI